MKNFSPSKALALGLVIAGAASASAQTDIARWNFNTIEAAPYNSPAATTDKTSATASVLGMTNSYNGGNTTSCDVLATSGDPDPLASGNAWRVRGSGHNGWALAAAQYTQGVEFDVSTAGYSNIALSFDFFSTTQGVADLQVQYNTDVTNAAGWTNFKGSFAGNVATVKDSHGDTELVATSSDWNTNGTNVKTNTINFATNSISGVANDAKFGIRLVSAYDPSLGTYGSAAGGQYNNTSGNWRFDQIAVSGQAVPEPSSVLLLSMAGLGVIVLRRRS